MIIKKSKSLFEFGNCALVAIGQAFDISPLGMKAIVTAMGIRDYHYGITERNCDRIIKYLTRLSDELRCRYIHNERNLDVEQTYKVYKKRKGVKFLLLNFEEHITYMKGNTVYDTYIKDAYQYAGSVFFRELQVPLGWWVVSDPPPIKTRWIASGIATSYNYSMYCAC